MTRCIELSQTVSSGSWSEAFEAAKGMLALHSKQDAKGAGEWRKKASAIALAVINENRVEASRLSAELQRPPPS